MVKCDGTQSKEFNTLPKAARKDCHLVRSGNNAVGSPSSGVNASSAFVVKSVDGSQEGVKIKYGQPFALASVDGSAFLHSNTRSYDSNVAQSSRLQAVDFVSVYNHECDWVTTCLNPKFRLEAEGSHVLANEKIVIFHMKTNKALGVVTSYNNSSKFELVANTFLTSHKAEDDNNHWKLVTNVPSIAVPERA